jgi:hypothetical protein
MEYVWGNPFASDGPTAIHQLAVKFGKFLPTVVVPGHHKPSELDKVLKERRMAVKRPNELDVVVGLSEMIRGL